MVAVAANGDMGGEGGEGMILKMKDAVLDFLLVDPDLADFRAKEQIPNHKRLLCAKAAESGLSHLPIVPACFHFRAVK